MNLRELQELIVIMYAENLLDDDEFLLLYDINQPKNPEFPYWLYPRFDLERYTEDECRAMFRFKKHDIYDLVEALEMPVEFLCPNRQKIDSVEAFCTLLVRFAYPCRLSELVPIYLDRATSLDQTTSFVWDTLFSGRRSIKLRRSPIERRFAITLFICFSARAADFWLNEICI